MRRCSAEGQRAEMTELHFSDEIVKIQRKYGPFFDAHAHLGRFSGWAAGLESTPETLIAQADRFGIQTTALCCEDNDRTLDAMKRFPRRVLGCVYVNPLRPEAVDLIDHFVREGFGAVKLQPLRHAYCADDVIVDPVLDRAEKYGIPVCIHSGHPPYSLPWQIALLAERHPGVKILMLHMGHGHGVYIDAALKMARRLPNLYLEMSGMPMPAKIREAYETVGPDRILFGTDTPFHDPSVEIEKVLTSGVDETGLKRIFFENARSFFRVAER